MAFIQKDHIIRKMQKYQEGFYLVDKPSGPSSHAIVNYFRHKSGIKKVGHCGTLDPLASGLLIILVGREYTKQQSLYLKKDKTYLVKAQLGIKTDTYDILGKITAKTTRENLLKVEKKDLLAILPQFTGKIQQEVPIFSAVKVKGQKLYHKARKGERDIKLPSRQVEIKEIKLLEFNKEDMTFSLEVSVSSGTYIRSLINDIGKKLNVGATVIELRRTQIADFHVKNAINLDNFHVKNKKTAAKD